MSGRVEHVRGLGVVDPMCNGAVDPPRPHLDADSVVLPHGGELRRTADHPTPLWDEAPLPIVLEEVAPCVRVHVDADREDHRPASRREPTFHLVEHLRFEWAEVSTQRIDERHDHRASSACCERYRSAVLPTEHEIRSAAITGAPGGRRRRDQRHSRVGERRTAAVGAAQRKDRHGDRTPAQNRQPRNRPPQLSRQPGTSRDLSSFPAQCEPPPRSRERNRERKYCGDPANHGADNRQSPSAPGPRRSPTRRGPAGGSATPAARASRRTAASAATARPARAPLATGTVSSNLYVGAVA